VRKDNSLKRLSVDYRKYLTDSLAKAGRGSSTFGAREKGQYIRETSMGTLSNLNHPVISTAAPGAGIIDTACLMA
jgi:hypothetical protein